MGNKFLCLCASLRQKDFFLILLSFKWVYMSPEYTDISRPRQTSYMLRMAGFFCFFSLQEYPKC